MSRIKNLIIETAKESQRRDDNRIIRDAREFLSDSDGGIRQSIVDGMSATITNRISDDDLYEIVKDVIFSELCKDGTIKEISELAEITE